MTLVKHFQPSLKFSSYSRGFCSDKHSSLFCCSINAEEKKVDARHAKQAYFKNLSIDPCVAFSAKSNII
jgi:hypothetical protein